MFLLECLPHPHTFDTKWTLSAREIWPSCPESWDDSTDENKMAAARRAFRPKGFLFFSNRGIWNRIMAALRLPINTETAKRVDEALNNQSEISEIKEQLSRVKDLLTKIIDSKINLRERVD